MSSVQPSLFTKEQCESCHPWQEDSCAVGELYDCKIIVKPMVYDHIAPVIIVAPNEHAPIWQLSESSFLGLHKVLNLVSEAFVKKGQFPNFFAGGNINNSKFGLGGVHAHVHVEPRVVEDPQYNTFPGHVNKRMLTKVEIEAYKEEWKKLLF